MSSAFLMLDTKHKRKVQETWCLVLSTENEALSFVLSTKNVDEQDTEDEALFFVLDTKNVDEEDTKNEDLCVEIFPLKYLTNKKTPAKINIYYSIYTKNVF